MQQETSPASPPPREAPPASSRARLAVSVLFFVNGVVFAAWAANIPVVKQTLGLEPGTLGMVLLAIPVGAVVGMPLSGWLAPLLGSRRIALEGARHLREGQRLTGDKEHAFEGGDEVHYASASIATGVSEIS